MCIVVGGGRIGSRKADTLVRAGAEVSVISPQATTDVAAMAEHGNLRWLAREYKPGDLEGAFLAVAATDDEAINAALVQEAEKGGILVCDASSASRSDVIFGALHTSEESTLAVFTDGRDPALARRIRDRIASLRNLWEGE